MANAKLKPDAEGEPQKHTYVVQTTTWIGPHLKQPDDEVKLTEAAAEYYVPHILRKKETAAPAKPSSKGKS